MAQRFKIEVEFIETDDRNFMDDGDPARNAEEWIKGLIKDNLAAFGDTVLQLEVFCSSYKQGPTGSLIKI